MTREEMEIYVEMTAAKLGEHFPSVQILCSFPADGGGTSSIKKGSGDWYARQGLAHEFIAEDIARDNARHIANAIKESEE